MSINIAHVAIYAMDLENSRDFYVRFFNGKCDSHYQSTHGFSSYFISFENGARLEIMHAENLKRQEPAEFASGWSHVAFSVGSREMVLEITQKIVDAGYLLYSAPRQTGDGYFESCVADPDGNRVEITI